MTSIVGTSSAGVPPRIAGWSGVLAGLGLLIESVLWVASGWNSETFDDPATALAYLESDGTTLRWAVFAGFVNLVLLVVLTVGLADRLRATTPALAALTKWFGVIGITAHLIVPMVHWYGVPVLLDAAERDPRAAQDAWTALVVVGHYAPGGIGALFLGLSMASAGCAVIARRQLPILLGWTALLAGVVSMLTVFEPDTPLSALASAAFTPSLALAVIVRTWAGIALMRSAQQSRTSPQPVRPGAQPS